MGEKRENTQIINTENSLVNTTIHLAAVNRKIIYYNFMPHIEQFRRNAQTYKKKKEKVPPKLTGNLISPYFKKLKLQRKSQT